MSDEKAKYKAFVDSLLLSGPSDLESYAAVESEEGEAAKTLLSRLSPADRALVDRLLSFARETGAYLTVESLSEQLENESLEIDLDGVALSEQVYGDDLADDWIRRTDGDPWPDEATCEVHGATLQPESVPILWGLIRPSTEYFDALTTFPHAHAVVYGGCMVGSETTRRVFYCEACRRALAAWSRASESTMGLPLEKEEFWGRYGG